MFLYITEDLPITPPPPKKKKKRKEKKERIYYILYFVLSYSMNVVANPSYFNVYEAALKDI